MLRLADYNVRTTIPKQPAREVDMSAQPRIAPKRQKRIEAQLAVERFNAASCFDPRLACRHAVAREKTKHIKQGKAKQSKAKQSKARQELRPQSTVPVA